MNIKGARVKLSEAGRAVVRRMPNRLGSVVGFSRDGEAYWVVWDHLVTREPWLIDYLEVVASASTPPEEPQCDAPSSRP